MVCQETPRQRTAENAAETLTATFQCGIGVFNMGDLVRREHPFSVSAGGKINSGSRLTLLMRSIMQSYCHIMLICEADKLEDVREHLARSAVCCSLCPDSTTAVCVKGHPEQTSIRRLDSGNKPGCYHSIWEIKFGKKLGSETPTEPDGIPVHPG